MFTVTSPLHESRLLWLHDPHPRQSPRSTVQLEKQTVPRNTISSVPKNNNKSSVPKKSDSTRNSSDARVRAPLDDIASATWYNTSLSQPSVSDKSSRVCKPVPRNIKQRDVENTGPHPVTQSSRPSKKKRVNYSRRE